MNATECGGPTDAEPAALTTNDRLDRATLVERITALVTVLLPVAGVAGAVALFWGRGVSTLDLGMCLALYTLTVAGVTVGFHRLFTHRSFQCGKGLRAVLGVMGSMAAQGPVLFWVAIHRRHHQFSDTPEDPHSPHLHGGGMLGILRGFWHAHVGWMLSHTPENYLRYAPDLARDRLVVRLSRLYPVWVLLGLLAPAVIGGLVTQSWVGAASGFLWGGLVRTFLVHHVTWSTNSLAHMFGTQAYNADDHSRNVVLLSIPSMGESWHNNHHAFPTSARHGLKWWQIDLSYSLIRTLKWVGLTWNIQVPTPAQMARKKHARLVGPLG